MTEEICFRGLKSLHLSSLSKLLSFIIIHQNHLKNRLSKAYHSGCRRCRQWCHRNCDWPHEAACRMLHQLKIPNSHKYHGMNAHAPCEQQRTEGKQVCEPSWLVFSLSFTHTWSELSLRILLWNASDVQKTPTQKHNTRDEPKNIDMYIYIITVDIDRIKQQRYDILFFW